MNSNYRPSDASLGIGGERAFGGEDAAKRLEAGLNVTRLVYVLHAIAPAAFGITFFVAIFINYSRLELVAGTLFESHFRYQIRTFWFSLLYTMTGVAALLLALWRDMESNGEASVWVLVALGLLLMSFSLCWHIYRAIKGFMRLADRKPMYED